MLIVIRIIQILLIILYISTIRLSKRFKKDIFKKIIISFIVIQLIVTIFTLYLFIGSLTNKSKEDMCSRAYRCDCPSNGEECTCSYCSNKDIQDCIMNPKKGKTIKCPNKKTNKGEQ